MMISRHIQLNPTMLQRWQTWCNGLIDLWSMEFGIVEIVGMEMIQMTAELMPTELRVQEQIWMIILNVASKLDWQITMKQPRILSSIFPKLSCRWIIRGYGGNTFWRKWQKTCKIFQTRSCQKFVAFFSGFVWFFGNLTFPSYSCFFMKMIKNLKLAVWSSFSSFFSS